MSSKLVFLSCILLAASGAIGQRTAPAGRAGQDRLPPAELARKIMELGRQLPSANVKASGPTPGQQAKAAEACNLYKKAHRRLEQLDRQGKLNLSVLGIRAGFAAGDPEIMLSGARLRWRLEKQNKLTDYDGYVLAWAGIFAGDPAAATQGLRHLVENSSQKPLAAWARGMLPIAAQCDKAIRLRFSLIGGAKVDLQRLAGKVVVLHFWASWSSASIETIPNLKSFYDARRADRNFVLIGISMDPAESKTMEHIRQSGMNWPQAVDKALRGHFLGRGAPHVVVVSATGHILWQGHPALKDTMVFTTDFARRQAGRMAKRKRPTTRPRANTRRRPEQPRPKSTTQHEAQAEEKYKQARMYMKLRMRRKARAVLEEIVRKYPATRAADKARLDLRYWH